MSKRNILKRCFIQNNINAQKKRYLEDIKELKKSLEEIDIKITDLQNNNDKLTKKELKMLEISIDYASLNYVNIVFNYLQYLSSFEIEDDNELYEYMFWETPETKTINEKLNEIKEKAKILFESAEKGKSNMNKKHPIIEISKKRIKTKKY